MDIDKEKLKGLLWAEAASYRADCAGWKRNTEALDEFLGDKTVVEVALELLAENVRLCEDPHMRAIRSLRGDCADLMAERDQLKAENEALRKDSESYRLLSFCHGQGTLKLVRSHHELCAEIRRLKIIAGEPVPPTPEEFVGPNPEGPTARIRRHIAAMGKGEQS